MCDETSKSVDELVAEMTALIEKAAIQALEMSPLIPYNEEGISMIRDIIKDCVPDERLKELQCGVDSWDLSFDKKDRSISIKYPDSMIRFIELSGEDI